MEKVKITSGDQNLSASLIKPENLKSKNPALFFIHGWSSNQTGNIERAKALAKIGFICLTIDLRGHGESDGKLGEFSRKDHLEDVLTAYDYLKSQPDVDPEKIGVIGASYGAYLGAILTLHRKIKWLIMRVPALYFDKNFDVPTLKLFEQDENAFRYSGLNEDQSKALKAFADFKGHILLVEGELDKVVLHDTIQNYLDSKKDKTNLEYVVMKGAPHYLETEKQKREFVEIMIKWFKGRV